MKSFKSLIIATILVFSVSGLIAQNKYEYATVTYAPSSKVVIVSINGSGFEEVKVEKGASRHSYDTNPALVQIAKLNEEGWDLFNTSTVGSLTTFVFVLRKEK